MARSGKGPTKNGTLRIIGGQWRGRKLSFSPVEGLRPTPDRVRETLFNWLTPVINGARCLDLFTGSGALGLEALSRGALSCDFVDTSTAALGQIEHHLQTLHAATGARCHAMPAMTFLENAREPYDVVFVDPPFNRGLVVPVCSQLDILSLVVAQGLVYIETSAADPAPTMPGQWRLHRDKVAGEVAYRLFEHCGDSAQAN
jgi:16S rRNA (guanine966-N2)-methyltransferase